MRISQLSLKSFVCWLILLPLLGCSPNITEPPKTSNSLSILAWNVESGRSDPATIATQLGAHSDCQIVALCEVSPKAADQYAKAIPGFESTLSATGSDDRLQFLINTERFEILERKEMDRYEDHELNNGNHRSPVWVRLKDRQTGSEFIVVNNHLARRKDDLRTAQAIGLREWARNQTTPIIAVGDYNFDFDFHTGQGNPSFVEFMRDGVWKWVKPDPLIDSNWADSNKDGKDDYPDSLLDFVFVANGAKDWDLEVEVVVSPGDFPDDSKTSDHRPVRLTIEPAGAK